MTREEKATIISALEEKIKNYNHFYITDIANLNAESTSKLRRMCNKEQIALQMVKNTLFRTALEKCGLNDANLKSVLNGSSTIMFSNTGNAPAKLIKEFRQKNNNERPILKAAYVEECVYVGNEQVDPLTTVKSKNDLIGDLIFLLQSPMRNVVSALQSGGHKISGILETLSKKSEE